MTNKHMKVWKMVSKKPLSVKQTGPKKPQNMRTNHASKRRKIMKI
jgi:hypothetical protein